MFLEYTGDGEDGLVQLRFLTPLKTEEREYHMPAAVGAGCTGVLDARGLEGAEPGLGLI